MAGERWLEASEVIPMFPTLVWKFLIEAGLRSAIDAKILATLEGMRRELPKLAPGQGWQSEQALHGREEFGQLAARSEERRVGKEGRGGGVGGGRRKIEN